MVRIIDRRVGDAMPHMLVEQPNRHALQCLGDCADLRQHVDTVRVLVDHALQSTHLTLDPLQTFEVVGLVHAVATNRGW